MPLSFPLVAIHPETHDVVLELVYASPNNVAGRPLYGRALCLLHRDADECLRRAVQIAAARGYRLKIFDGFRPHEAQVLLWNSAPDKAYVADPDIGSNHTRGTAVDLTLVDAHGGELDMGTGFDDMSTLSHHANDQVSPQAQANRSLLLGIMQEAGFEPIAHEWWHYALPMHPDHQLIDSARLGNLNPMHPD